MTLITIKHDGCIKCAGCCSVCPTGALELVGGKIEFYPEKCIEAGTCVKICPANVIEMVKRSTPEEKKESIKRNMARLKKEREG